MRTKINKFHDLLNDLRYNFQKILKENPEDIDEKIVGIESIYSRNKGLFPFEIKTLFEDLYTENRDSMKMLFWDNLKHSYYNLKDYIELDYHFFKNPNFTISDNFKSLFNHSKNLSYNYFTYISRIYYWYYGRDEKKSNKTIQVNYLSNYESEDLEKIKNYYAHQFELIEKEVKYSYAKDNFILEIVEPKYTENQELNSELEKLNAEHISKLEILKDYSNKITELIKDIRFEYPEFITDTSIRITFSKPQEVYNCIEKYLSSVVFREDLKNLIYGEIDSPAHKIPIICDVNIFSNFFQVLREKGITSIDTKEIIADWIVKNFQYKKAGKFVNFSRESILSWLKPNKFLVNPIEHPF